MLSYDANYNLLNFYSKQNWKKNLTDSVKIATTFNYPFQSSTGNIWKVPFKFKLKNSVNKIFPVKHKKRDKKVKIWLIQDKKPRSLSKYDFPLIFIVHNARSYLPSFLSHYRSMGVTRFLCVDDTSNDGTTEYLSKQTDVDLHFSNVRYKDAARSKTWRELLAEKYGKNRWYLNVDVDEYLFTGCNQRMSIAEYAKILYNKKIYRLPAPMIDMVSSGKLHNAVLDDQTKPWEICQYFDLDTYYGYVKSGGIKLYGGPRKRLWGANTELIKYPLIYWDKHTSMGVSIHSPLPRYRNHAPVCGALLHFKFFSDVEKISYKAIKGAQYFDNSREYKLMYDYFKNNNKSKLTYEKSIRFENEETLINHGMVRVA